MQIPMPSAPDGRLETYRSTAIGDKATAVDTGGPFTILIQLMFENGLIHFDITGNGDFSAKEQGKKRLREIMPSDMWISVLGFVFGLNTTDPYASVEQLGRYALCIDKPQLLMRHYYAGPLGVLFVRRPLFSLNPDHVIEAVLQGDQTMLVNMLRSETDLLAVGEGCDFSGRKFKGSALQAAIASGGFEKPRNSLEANLCKLFIEKIEKLDPVTGANNVHDQTLELYQKSLDFYIKKQSARIHALYEQNGEISAIRAEEKRLKEYELALHQKNLIHIINTHTNPNPQQPDAQKNHAIQVDTALIDAIAAATDDEIQAILDNPTIDSPLSNHIKQFRKDTDTLCQSEIIANPQHVIKLFTLYNQFFNRIQASDNNWKKREIFWCHLVGYVQRYFTAYDAQLFAHYDINKTQRSFNLPLSSESIFPLAFDSNSGLGYRFAVLHPINSQFHSRTLPTQPPQPKDVESTKKIYLRHLLSRNNELIAFIRTNPDTPLSHSM